MQSYYPERLGKLYLVHAPIIFWSAWKLVVPFIHPVTKEKVTLQLRHVCKSSLSVNSLGQDPHFPKSKPKRHCLWFVEENSIHSARSFVAKLFEIFNCALQIEFLDKRKVSDTLSADIHKEEMPTMYGGLKELVSLENTTVTN